MKETFTREEAAEYLITELNTLDAMIEAGELPAGRIGKAYVLHLDDLRDFLRREIVRQTAERAELARKVASGAMPRSERPRVKSAGAVTRGRPRGEKPDLGASAPA
jgi:excisionase family DNA binding protein